MSMHIATRPPKSSLALALVVLLAGSGVMSVLSTAFPPAAEIPNWQDFAATTIGDTLVLPVLVLCLHASWKTLSITTARGLSWPFVAGGVVGVLGGAGVQLSWLLDTQPRLTWVLPQVHRFSLPGWYHAIFLTLMSGLVVGLAAGVAHALWVAKRSGQQAKANAYASSPLLLSAMTSAWFFSVLVVHDGGEGSSLLWTVLSVIISSLSLAAAVLILVGARALPALSCAVLSVGALTVLLANFHGSGSQWLALALSASLATGVVFRDAQWTTRGVEFLLVFLVLTAGALLALSSADIVHVLLIAFPGVTTAVYLASAAGSRWRQSHEGCGWRISGATAVILSAQATSAWLRNQPGDYQVWGNVLGLAYSVLFVAQALPPVRRDMRRLMQAEAASQTVTADVTVNHEATRVALRAGAWGAAAVVGVLLVFVAAAPSMDFQDGVAEPALTWRPLQVQGGLALLAALSVGVWRDRPWTPYVAIAAALAVGGVAWQQLLELPPLPWWPALLGGALVFLWELESIVANAAMRPSWAVRRGWRWPIAFSIAVATTSTYVMAAVGGSFSRTGSTAPMLRSFSALAGAIAVNLLLTLAAGMALDWRRDLAATSTPVTAGAAPNWARYRLRGSLLQDFGLLQLLVAVGMWLPFSAIIRINPATPSLASGIAVAASVLLLFTPVFFVALRNSVAHIGEQSRKASRPHAITAWGVLPAVAVSEETSTLRAMFASREGPRTQREWASVLAVHQLHLNVLALAMGVVSLLGLLLLLLSDEAEDDGP